MIHIIISAFLLLAKNIAATDISEIREKRNIPALLALTIKNGIPQNLATSFSGFRRAESREPITLEDKFHLGSCTKAMTAMLIGILVDDEKVRWDTTVADIFTIPIFKE